MGGLRRARADHRGGCGVTKTVLTIDDSRTMRDMLLLALEDAGFTVIQAVDGVEGLELSLIHI